MSKQQHIQDEMRDRANFYKQQTCLLVDYYRVRRKVAYPLPIRQIVLPDMPMKNLPVYPWAIWMTWNLEERVHSLAWAGTWFQDDEAVRHT